MNLLIPVLMNWYSHCYAFVRWHGALSNCFEILAGVRQGGVISPSLFALYVDELIVKLQSAGLGCIFHGVYTRLGCVMCADDLALLAYSISTRTSGYH